MESVHLQLPADLLARVDKARGDVPRNAWLRRAVERALTLGAADVIVAERADGIVAGKNPPDASKVHVALTKQPLRQSVPGPNVENIRSSSQSKRNVRPIPKREK